jgi:glycosyltransferase involved in cell wall biosynthesis
MGLMGNGLSDAAGAQAARDGHHSSVSVTLLLPVLNEIEGLRLTLPNIDRTLFAEILAVDGKSTDGSVEFLRDCGVRVITQVKPGIQNAVTEGLAEVRTDCVIEFSPDGNCLPELLPDIVGRLREGNDIVVVSRYLGDARSKDDTMLTGFGNWVFSCLFSLVGFRRVTDALTIYRGFRLAPYDHPQFRLLISGPVFEPATTAWAMLRGLRYAEIPGDEPLRVGSVSKMRPLYNGYYCLKLWLRAMALRLLRRIH